jgi:hypothetical protein
MENNINELIKNYIFDPNNSELNFKIGLYYDNINQTASAVSYYLRSAERTDDELLKYECLLRASSCFNRQGSRNFTVKGLIEHAISTCPDRPEGYYYLSKFYESESKWHDCYLISSIGEKLSQNNPKKHPTQNPRHKAHLKRSSKNFNLINGFLMKFRIDPYFRTKHSPIRTQEWNHRSTKDQLLVV